MLLLAAANMQDSAAHRFSMIRDLTQPSNVKEDEIDELKVAERYKLSTRSLDPLRCCKVSKQVCP